MVRDYLQKQKQLKDIYVTKVHLSMGDSSQKQKTWNTVHSLQAAPQIEEFPFQVPQLV